MTPLFGGTDKRDGQQAGDLGARAEIERLNSLPLEQLAAELVVVFPPKDAVDHGRVSAHDIALKMVPAADRLSQPQIWDFDELVGEGIQYLEHAGLTQCTVVGTDRRLQWVLTRRGRSASDSRQTAYPAPSSTPPL